MSKASRIQIYLETSVISAFHFGKGDILTATRTFFDVCDKNNHELYSSDIALREIERATIDETRRKLITLLERHSVRIVSFTDEAYAIAEQYLVRNVIPRKVTPDAQHIAICAANSINVLVSWNLRHIVNLRTKLMVKEIKTQLGYITSSIVKPDEVLMGYQND